jgi:nucleoid DNA-binding protein
MATKTTKQLPARPVSKLDLAKPVKVSASAKPRSKGEVFATIAQHVGIHRRDVAAVVHVMGSIIKADLSKGINPFTKEQVMFKAKPARNVVRVRPLKALKDMV